MNGRSLEWDARQLNIPILAWQFLFGTISIWDKAFGEVLDKGSALGFVKSLGKGCDSCKIRIKNRVLQLCQVSSER